MLRCPVPSRFEVHQRWSQREGIQENANVDEKLAQNKEDLEDIKKMLAEDEAFLAMLKEKCSAQEG